MFASSVRSSYPKFGILYSFHVQLHTKCRCDVLSQKIINTQYNTFLGFSCPSVSLTKDLTLQMLRLLSSKAQECKILEKPLKPCHLGIHLEALAEYSQMSTYLPGFQ